MAWKKYNQAGEHRRGKLTPLTESILARMGDKGREIRRRLEQLCQRNFSRYAPKGKVSVS